MLYFSTNKQSPTVNFREAAVSGQAPDKGLYFPEKIPHLTSDFLKYFRQKPKAEIAFEVIRPYVGDTIPEDELYRICADTVNFDFPLVKINDSVYSLELYHGPTLAFKDVGARFMSRCLGYFSKGNSQKITILVATSGDTGGAVANGFLGVEGVDVVILYPSGKVSNIQELQLTTLGQNITALEVEGTFDDCQRMVKQAFADEQLNKQLILTSANSINVARWLPQQFYYFYAIQQWQEDELPVVSVPSGNFGNICAGLLAHSSGLPVKHFIAACNSNDVFPIYLQTGIYKPKPAVSTYSNAMDVGDPSNFVRIMEIFQQQLNGLKSTLTGYTISDEETKSTLKTVYQNHNYLLDPHGAVAYNALEQYLSQHQNSKGVILETAHPVKFYDVIEPVINETVPVPDAVAEQIKKEKVSTKIGADVEDLRSYLLSKIK